MGPLPQTPRSGTNAEPQSQPRRSSFETLSSEELETHMGVNTYGVFELTDAVRPSYDLQVVPKQGFRNDAYVDPKTGNKVPVIMASATKNRLFDLFIDLIDPLGETVDVVLETSHDGTQEDNGDLYREQIDMCVLKSILYDFEELLLNDGCTGIAVLNPRKRQEVQFDEHKILICYGEPLDTTRNTLIESDVYPDEELRFITEAEHVHSSSDTFARSFEQLAMRLGMEVLAEVE